jgi:hypothetical protein
MPISPRRIVPDMLLMSALKIGNPIEAFIQVKIYDLAWYALRPSLGSFHVRSDPTTEFILLALLLPLSNCCDSWQADATFRKRAEDFSRPVSY